MDNIAGIVFGLSLLPIFALLYSLQTFIIIENERITKFTYGAKNNSSEIQIIIMEIKKVIVKNNSIRIFTSEHKEYSHLFRLKKNEDIGKVVSCLSEINSNILILT